MHPKQVRKEKSLQTFDDAQFALNIWSNGQAIWKWVQKHSFVCFRFCTVAKRFYTGRSASTSAPSFPYNPSVLHAVQTYRHTDYININTHTSVDTFRPSTIRHIQLPIHRVIIIVFFFCVKMGSLVQVISLSLSLVYLAVPTERPYTM